MGVDHGGSHIVVAEQFLDGSDVIAAFEPMRGKAMAECVAGCPFGKARLANGLFERLLKNGLVHRMPPCLSSSSILPAMLLGSLGLSAATP
jgi:hypothetical protein